MDDNNTGNTYNGKVESPILSVNEIKDPNKYFRDLMKKYDPKFILYMPSASEKELEEIRRNVNKLSAEDFLALLGGQDGDSFALDMMGPVSFINKNNVYGKTLNEDKESFTNNMGYNDIKMNMCPVEYKEGNTSSENVELMLCKAFGIGEMINIPLWNSGFWIRLKPITPTEMVSLEIELAKNTIDYGKDTLGLIYSNESVIYTEALSGFIKDHIVATNLALPSGDDIRNYISINDYYPIILAMITSMQPSGTTYKISCGNALQDGTQCKFKAEILIDTKKLLWVNRKRITPDMYSVMANKKPNSVTVEKALEYQKMLSDELNAPNEVTIKMKSGNDVVIGLKVPSLLYYVNKGSEWVNSIISMYHSLVSNLADKDDKSGALTGLIVSQLMCVYSPYVAYVKTPNGTFSTDKFEIVVELLKKMDVEDGVYSSFVDGVSEFIDRSSVSIVAMPDYQCPSCKQGHESDESKNKDFANFIPLNILHSFFVLGAQKALSRIQSAR